MVELLEPVLRTTVLVSQVQTCIFIYIRLRESTSWLPLAKGGEFAIFRVDTLIRIDYNRMFDPEIIIVNFKILIGVVLRRPADGNRLGQ